MMPIIHVLTSTYEGLTFLSKVQLLLLFRRELVMPLRTADDAILTTGASHHGHGPSICQCEFI